MIKTWQERCEEHPDHEGIVTEQMIRERMQEEIDELRQALEDHVDLATVGEVGVWGEKPPVKTYSGGKPNYCTPVDDVNISAERVDETAKGEQEPVAYVTIEPAFDGDWRKCPSIKWVDKPVAGPLYTAPPKREWVGLTEVEIYELMEFDEYEDQFDFAYAIEAKLKEKNNA